VAETDSRTGLGELTVLLPSWRLHLEAANLTPRTIRAYTDDGALFAAFLARQVTLTAVVSIQREHVEAFIVPSWRALRRRPPRPATAPLQQLLEWLDGWKT
jgi:hypothetical protein